jgi:DNA-binding transcriptional ArsR family regulator
MPQQVDNGFDPAQDVVLDARNLRGLAHPLRLRMLAILREEGPATATALAQRLGESSAATSYHLRQLAAYGFIVEAEERGAGRERWWRSAHRSTYFDHSDDADEDTRLLGDEYLRAVARAYATRIEGWVDSLATIPAPWRDAGTISDYRLRLTADQATELMRELNALGHRYRDVLSQPAADDQEPRAPVRFQFQVLPDIREPRDQAEEPADA